MEAAFVVWIVLCLFVAAVARARRRSGLGWFLISALLSPLVGMALVLLIRPRGDSELTRIRKILSEKHATPG